MTVKTVAVAPAVLTLRVTQKHIDAGEMLNAYQCPLALAARDAGAFTARAMPTRVEAVFRVADTTEDEDLVDTSYRVSPRARQFMEGFDHGHSVQPTTFRLTRINPPPTPAPRER